MAVPLKQSTASQELLLGPFVDDADGVTPMTGLTIANTDIKIWVQGATTLANKNSGGATHISGGLYYCVMDATDTATLGAFIVNVAASGALPIKQECVVLSANNYDSAIAASDVLQVDVTQWLGTAVATPTVAGVPEVDITHIGGDAQSGTDLKDFADAGYDPSTNKVQGVVLVDLATATTTATSVTTVNGLAANVITAASINTGAITNAKFAAGAIDAASIAANAIADTKIATGAITAAKFAAGAVDAAALAADAGTEIAAAVLAAATAAPIAADIQAVNAVTIVGNGAGTPWGP